MSNWYEDKKGYAEHLVYLDSKAKELQKMLDHEKSMIIRGAAGRKTPLGGRVRQGDMLYFVETGGDLMVTHRAIVTEVVESEKMTVDQSHAFVEKYSDKLMLASHQKKRWAGKKFLCVISVGELEAIEQFKYNRLSNMDDWIITNSIDEIK